MVYSVDKRCFFILIFYYLNLSVSQKEKAACEPCCVNYCYRARRKKEHNIFDRSCLKTPNGWYLCTAILCESLEIFAWWL